MRVTTVALLLAATAATALGGQVVLGAGDDALVAADHAAGQSSAEGWSHQELSEANDFYTRMLERSGTSASATSKAGWCRAPWWCYRNIGNYQRWGSNFITYWERIRNAWKKAEKEAQEFQQTAAKERRQAASLRNQIVKVRMVRQSLTGVLEGAMDLLKQEKRRRSKLAREAAQVVSRAQAAEAMHQGLNHTATSLKQEIERVVAETEQDERRTDELAELTMQELEDAGRISGEAAAKRVQLTLDIEEDQDEIKADQQRTEALVAEVKDIERRRNETKDAVKSAHEEYNRLVAARDAAQGEAQALEMQITTLQSKFTAASDEKRAAMDHAATEAREQAETEQQDRLTSGKADALSKEQTFVDRVLEQNKVAATGASAELAVLAERRQTLLRRIEALGNASSTLREKKEALEHVHDELRANATAVKDDLANARRVLAKQVIRQKAAEALAERHRARADSDSLAGKRAHREALGLAAASTVRRAAHIETMAEGLMGFCDCSEDSDGCSKCGPKVAGAGEDAVAKSVAAAEAIRTEANEALEAAKLAMSPSPSPPPSPSASPSAPASATPSPPASASPSPPASPSPSPPASPSPSPAAEETETAKRAEEAEASAEKLIEAEDKEDEEDEEEEDKADDAKADDAKADDAKADDAKADDAKADDAKADEDKADDAKADDAKADDAKADDAKADDAKADDAKADDAKADDAKADEDKADEDKADEEEAEPDHSDEKEEEAAAASEEARFRNENSLLEAIDEGAAAMRFRSRRTTLRGTAELGSKALPGRRADPRDPVKGLSTRFRKVFTPPKNWYPPWGRGRCVWRRKICLWETFAWGVQNHWRHKYYRERRWMSWRRNNAYRRRRYTKRLNDRARNLRVQAQNMLETETKTNEALRAQAKEAGERRDAILKQMKSIDKQMQDAYKGLAAAQGNVETARFDVEDLKETRVADHKSLERAKETEHKADEIHTSAAQSLAASRKQALETETSLRKDMAELEERLRVLGTALSGLQMREESVSSELQVALGAKGIAEAEEAAARSEAEAADTLRDERSAFKAKLEEDIKSAHDVTVGAKEAAIASAAAIKSSRESIKATKAEMRTLRAKLERTKAAMHAASSAHAMGSSDASSVGIAVRRLQDAVSDKESEADALKARLARVAEESRAFRTQVESSRAARESLEGLVSAAKAKVEAAGAIERKEARAADAAAAERSARSAERDALASRRGLVIRTPIERISETLARRRELEGLVGGERAESAKQLLNEGEPEPAEEEAEDITDLVPAPAPEPTPVAETEEEDEPVDDSATSRDQDQVDAIEADTEVSVADLPADSASGDRELDASMGLGRPPSDEEQKAQDKANGVEESSDDASEAPPALPAGNDAGPVDMGTAELEE